jgi:fatty aldehyde decarbonylase
LQREETLDSTNVREAQAVNDAAVGVNAFRQAGRGDKYYHLISYIVSNTIAGEYIATDNYSEEVHLFPDLETKSYLLHQAEEEARHAKTLVALCKRLNIPVVDRPVEPQWLSVRNAFATAVQKRDVISCVIIQDIMIETMAVVLYRTLSGLEEADTDPETRRVAAAILKDELEHLDWGRDWIRERLKRDEAAVHASLVWSHNQVMPQLFGLIRNGCDFLCGEIGVECGTFGVDEIKTDLDTLRLTALDHYIESLDRCGFHPRVTSPLIASMSSYEGMPAALVGVKTGGPAV